MSNIFHANSMKTLYTQLREILLKRFRSLNDCFLQADGFPVQILRMGVAIENGLRIMVPLKAEREKMKVINRGLNYAKSIQNGDWW